MKTTISITVLLVLLLCSSTFSETYKWTDDKGIIHFTDDPSTIPEKYRDEAKSRQTEEDRMSIGERLLQKREEEKRREAQESKEKYERALRDQSLQKSQREIENQGYGARETQGSASGRTTGAIPFDRFKHLTEGMSEAEVLSQFGPPDREEMVDARTAGYVGLYGNVDLKTSVIKRYYYIGDREKGERTTIIHIINGKVFRHERIL